MGKTDAQTKRASLHKTKTVAISPPQKLVGETAEEQAQKMLWNVGNTIEKKVATAATYYQQRAR
jgi:hypothetical protein